MKIVYTWLLVSLGFLMPLHTQTLVSWPLTPAKLGTPNSFVPAAEGIAFIRGNGLSALSFSGSGVSTQNWSTATADADALVDYYEFGVKALAGETIEITELQFSERRSSAGPRRFRVVVSTNDFATATELASLALPDNIYSRDHSIAINRKISDGERLLVRLYADEAESNSGSWTILDDALKLLGSTMPACTAPDVAGTISLLSAETTTATVRLSGGNGQARLVVIAPAGQTMASPYQGSAYAGSLTYGLGDELGSQTFVLAATSASAVDLPVDGLTPGTNYEVAVFEYNTAAMCYAEVPALLSFSTLCDAISRPINELLFTALDEQVALRWEQPLCAERYLIIASEAPISGAPSELAYDASTSYGSVASAAGFSAGTYPVYYSGELAPLIVESLDNGALYYFAAYALNDGIWSDAYTFTATPQAGCERQAGERIFINEFHYNNGPVAQDVGVEIAGPAEVDLRPYEVVVFRVVGSSTPIYIEQSRTQLSGLIDDEGQGVGALWFPLADLPENRGAIGLRNTITGEVVDQVEYDSRFGIYVEVILPHADVVTTLLSGLVELPTDPAGYSLQRIGEGECAGEFLWAWLPQTRGRLNIGQAILPVELAYLAGEAVDKTARIYWETTTESGSDYFVLERSADGRNFEELAKIPAAGFSAAPLQYEYYDRNPLPGENFYRLRQYDYDGTAYDLGIVNVHFRGSAKPQLSIYPNPVVDQATVQWNIPAESLRLLDAQGRVIRHWSIDASGSDLNFTVDLSALPAGTYVLRLEGAQNVINQPIVKK